MDLETGQTITTVSCSFCLPYGCSEITLSSCDAGADSARLGEIDKASVIHPKINS